MHHFDVIFTTRHAAGAAHDRSCGAHASPSPRSPNFVGSRNRRTRSPPRILIRAGKDGNVDFEEVNFLTRLGPTCAASSSGPSRRNSRASSEPENRRKTKRATRTNARPRRRRRPPPAEKKKRRDPRAPRRVNVGGRVYDSRLGVTCHWCRQKTHEAHVSCTSPSCALPGSRLAVSFCGQCLKNRNGEDVFAARESGRWVCPRCRGSCGPGCASCCNCGPCRIAAGLKPTGPGIASAFAAGFGNVHDFLVGRETGEGREAVGAGNSASHGARGWRRETKRPRPPRRTPSRARRHRPAPPAMLDGTVVTPSGAGGAAADGARGADGTATPTTRAMPLAVVARRGLVVPAAASASAAVADLRRAARRREGDPSVWRRACWTTRTSGRSRRASWPGSRSGRERTRLRRGRESIKSGVLVRP